MGVKSRKWPGSYATAMGQTRGGATISTGSSTAEASNAIPLNWPRMARTSHQRRIEASEGRYYVQYLRVIALITYGARPIYFGVGKLYPPTNLAT